MSKRIKINEQQLALLVNYIQESANPIAKPVVAKIELNENNIIEEGFKDWAIAGLMTLAALGGVKAQTDKGINPETIKAAELVQNKLEQGDATLLKYFDEAGIEKNRENLDKLINADVKGKFRTATASPEELPGKLQYGYAVSDFEITRDTLVNSLPQRTIVDTSYSTKFDSDLFMTAKYDLDESVRAELNKIVKLVKSKNGKIYNIRIESSTDTEPIKMGNEKLAQLRAESISNYLTSLGVDASEIEVITKPEQGPDVYSKTMSDEERAEARIKTKDFRYVKLDYDISMPLIEYRPGDKIYDVIENITFELIRPVTKGGEKLKIHKHKPEKCKVRTPGKPVVYKCPK
jgi:outer membrane protein OmpA-like peptidoglycan-associated protein